MDDEKHLSLAISTDPSPTGPDGRPKRQIPAEFAWIVYFTCVSIGVAFMAHANFGLLPAAAFPQALSAAFPSISFGAFYVLYQVGLIAIISIVRRTLDWRYLISFVVCGIGGLLIDFHSAWIAACIPNDALAIRVACYLAGFVIVSVTVFFSTRCMLPIMPIDTFSRDLSQAIRKPYPRVKVAFDVSLFVLTCLIDIFFLHYLFAVGIGTVFAALFLGRAVGLIHRWADKRFCFKKHLPL